MYAKNYNQRGFASLESVKSASSGKQKLRIRLPKALVGRSPYLSLGLDDTPKNRAQSSQKVEAINSDIINECFDVSLEKYKPQAKKASHIAKLKSLNLPSIDNLYQRYIEVLKDSCSPNTYFKNYLHWLKRLRNKDIAQECLEISEDGARRLLVYLEKRKYTKDANRRLLVQLNACCQWAIENSVLKVDFNPYEKILKGTPKPKKKRKIPSFFSKEEIGTIIDAFASNQYYSHYTNYIAFLFATGARPSETVCLTWDDIDSRFIHFTKRMVESESGKIVRNGLKSEDHRKFPLNNLISSILENQKQRQLKNKLVFPSPHGGMIHIQNFSRRGWKKILENLEMIYKRPYTSRASFITHTLEHLDPKDIGRICGNLPETIYRHYAGSNVSSLHVPDAF